MVYSFFMNINLYQYYFSCGEINHSIVYCVSIIFTEFNEIKLKNI